MLIKDAPIRALVILVVLAAGAALLAGRAAVAENRTAAATLTAEPGGVRVFDGDTIEFDGRVIHLAGIDAPELGQECTRGSGVARSCGLDAAYDLRKKMALYAKPIECKPERKVDGALIAICTSGEEDVALVMVESGNAVVMSNGPADYRLAEAQAKRGSLGIWSGEFVPPWEWRKRAEASPQSNRGGERGCIIKGIAGTPGERLYYGTLDELYQKLPASPSKGDRWFCSDDEARKAGWRRPEEKPAG